MPELPEVETVCRALRPALTGRVIESVRTTVDRLRLPIDAAELTRHARGRAITDVRRRGKFIVTELEDCRALIIHLGMTGSLRICPDAEAAGPYERVIWTLRGGDSWRLADIRRFGSVQSTCLGAPGALPDSLAQLGAEPLDASFLPRHLHELTRRRTRPIKNLIMDHARIDPVRPSGTLTRRECTRLLNGICETLQHAIAAGGTTIANFRSVDGTEGEFARELSVYGRKGQPCKTCGQRSAIVRLVQAGRSTFFCPRCQR